MKNVKRPFSSQPARWFRLPVFLLVLTLGGVSCSSPSIDSQTEAALLSRVEAKHQLFPTYVYGQSKNGNPVIYKPSLSGLRDFRRFFVLQTDSYMIDLWLQATGASSFTLVLDFAALSNRMRTPTLDMWEALRTVADPLPPAARVSIEQMVARVFSQCEAVVVVNANAWLKMLRPVIGLMAPVTPDKLFISTDLSALGRMVEFTEVPKPYNPNADASVSSNPQTALLYSIINERARELLGRDLEIEPLTALPQQLPAQESHVKQLFMGQKPQPASESTNERPETAAEDDDDDNFDDID